MEKRVLEITEDEKQTLRNLGWTLIGCETQKLVNFIDNKIVALMGVDNAVVNQLCRIKAKLNDCLENGEVTHI